jgi:hypothetical protein
MPTAEMHVHVLQLLLMKVDLFFVVAQLGCCLLKYVLQRYIRTIFQMDLIYVVNSNWLSDFFVLSTFIDHHICLINEINLNL